MGLGGAVVANLVANTGIQGDRMGLESLMMLTKLNYNACGFADGVPVALKFADAVGEILTAAPFVRIPPPPLPFRHYIELIQVHGFQKPAAQQDIAR